jgi:hypothetical protein
MKTQQRNKKKVMDHMTAQPMRKFLSTVRNYFALLQTPEMGVEDNKLPTKEQQQTPSTVSGRLPFIMLTSATNLIQLQNQLNGIV